MRMCAARSPGGCGRKPTSASPTRTAAKVSPRGNQAVLRRLGVADGAKQQVAPPVVHEVLHSGGRALDAPTRSFFENRMGADLGAVRLHDDARAAQSAQAVGAKAYAVGSHVVFDAGRVAPSRPEGRAVLAHELAHVVQAGAAPVPARLEIGRTDAPEERQATRAAASMAAGSPGSGLAGGAQALRRDPTVLPGDLVPDARVYGPALTPPAEYYEQRPYKVPDAPGKGPSYRDIKSALTTLTDKTLKLGLNNDTQMPNCSDLQNKGGARLAGKYMQFDEYNRRRMTDHSKLTSAPWPTLPIEQYNAFIDNCNKADLAAKQQSATPAATPAAAAPATPAAAPQIAPPVAPAGGTASP